MYCKRLNSEFKMRLYALRDKTRLYAIENKIDRNEWIFRYFDESISKTISKIDYLNIFIISILHSRQTNNKNYLDFRKKSKNQLMITFMQRKFTKNTVLY